ncbi:MAG: hypothetical protein ACI84C_001946 [Flavobacteriales bacterium]|jgi:hypothetical protein
MGQSESEKLFFRNELRALIKGGISKKLILPSFVFFALFGVIAASSGLDYLEDKMNDPYVNWIDIPVTTDMQGKYAQIVDSLEYWQNVERCRLAECAGFYRFSMFFFGSDNDQQFVHGRTVNPNLDKALLGRILVEEQIVLDFRNSKENEHRNSERMWRSGIIITEDVYTHLFGDAQPKQIAVRKGDLLSPVMNVIAVVKKLPGKASFICSNSFHWSITYDISKTKIQMSSAVDSMVVWTGSEYNNEESVKRLKKELRDSDYGGYFESIDVAPLESGLISHNSRIRIGLRESADIGLRREIFKGLLFSVFRGDKPRMATDYVFIKSKAEEQGLFAKKAFNEQYHWFSLGFSEIDSIRPFSELIQSVEVEMDLNKIESLENFNLVSVLTGVLGGLLLLFALVAVIIFIYNLVSSHLDHIKDNLGTFRAFGITKSFLVKAYLRIVLTLLSVSLALAIVLMLIINYSGFTSLILGLLNYDDEIAQMELNIFDPWVLVMIVLLYSSTYIVTKYSVEGIVKNSPGDLIYKRV